MSLMFQCPGVGTGSFTIGTSTSAGAPALSAEAPALVDVPMVNDPVPTPGHWNINDIFQGRFE